MGNGACCPACLITCPWRLYTGASSLSVEAFTPSIPVVLIIIDNEVVERFRTCTPIYPQISTERLDVGALIAEVVEDTVAFGTIAIVIVRVIALGVELGILVHAYKLTLTAYT